MNISINDAHATKIWFDKDNIWVMLADGRQISVPLSYFPRLLKATPADRELYSLSGGGTGIHWEKLDEDISVNGLLLGIGDLTQHKIVMKEPPTGYSSADKK